MIYWIGISLLSSDLFCFILIVIHSVGCAEINQELTEVFLVFKNSNEVIVLRLMDNGFIKN